MPEVGNKEVDIRQIRKLYQNRIFEKLDSHYTPDYIKEIHNKNACLWQEPNPDQFWPNVEQWIYEIRNGSGESKGLIALRGQSIQPHVTIVIPTYNEEKKILQVLQSIAAQHYSKGIEVLVVDNNSNPEDRGASFAEACGAKVIKYNLPDNSPDKKLSQIALARQKGLESASGEIIISTDADIIAPRDWVRLITELLDQDQNIAAVAGGVAHYDRGDKPRASMLDILLQKSRPLKTARLNRTDPSQISPTETKGVTPGANTAYRKADALEISGYDTRIYPGEDTNIGLRLLRLGKIAYLKNPDSTVRVSPRRFAKTSLVEGWKKMRKRGANSNAVIYLDDKGNPIIER